MGLQGGLINKLVGDAKDNVWNNMSDVEVSLEHQHAFVMAFILASRRERYNSQLNSEKKRPSFLDRLNHRFLEDLDDRYIIANPRFHDPLKAVSCYIIADQNQFDGKLVSPIVAQTYLDSATFGIVVSYLPGKLAAYKDESPSEIIWIERP